MSRTNRFKAGLQAGTPQVGMWASLASPLATEVLAGAGLDFVVIDSEHAPNDAAEIIAQLQACAAGGSTPAAVRAWWNDRVAIKRILDSGAETIVVPYVQTPDEAREAVASVRYPPAGARGAAGATRANAFGRDAGYWGEADDRICLVAQVETAAAVEAASDIAAVDGVDVVFVGPGDLAADLGVIHDRQHSSVRRALERALAKITAAGKPAGVMAGSIQDARDLLDMGFSMVSVATELVHLRVAVDKVVSELKDNA